MKCQFCGAENIRSHGPCRICGKALGEVGLGSRPREGVGAKPAGAPMHDVSYAARTERLTTEEIARGMRMEYAQWSTDCTQKVMETRSLKSPKDHFLLHCFGRHVGRKCEQDQRSYAVCILWTRMTERE